MENTTITIGSSGVLSAPLGSLDLTQSLILAAVIIAFFIGIVCFISKR